MLGSHFHRLFRSVSCPYREALQTLHGRASQKASWTAGFQRGGRRSSLAAIFWPNVLCSRFPLLLSSMNSAGYFWESFSIFTFPNNWRKGPSAANGFVFSRSRRLSTVAASQAHPFATSSRVPPGTAAAVKQRGKLFVDSPAAGALQVLSDYGNDQISCLNGSKGAPPFRDKVPLFFYLRAHPAQHSKHPIALLWRERKRLQ